MVCVWPQEQGCDERVNKLSPAHTFKVRATVTVLCVDFTPHTDHGLDAVHRCGLKRAPTANFFDARLSFEHHELSHPTVDTQSMTFFRTTYGNSSTFFNTNAFWPVIFSSFTAPSFQRFMSSGAVIDEHDWSFWRVCTQHSTCGFLRTLL